MSWYDDNIGIYDLDEEFIYGDSNESEEVTYVDNQGIEYDMMPVACWRTKENVLIPIKDMSYRHIRNCMWLIHKSRDTWRASYLPIFKEELERRKRLANS